MMLTKYIQYCDLIGYIQSPMGSNFKLLININCCCCSILSCILRACKLDVKLQLHYNCSCYLRMQIIAYKSHCSCTYLHSNECCVCSMTVAMELLQTTFELDLNDKTQSDQYKLKEPLEVCIVVHTDRYKDTIIYSKWLLCSTEMICS